MQMHQLDAVTRSNRDVVAGDSAIHEWIIQNQLNPEATQCLLQQDGDVQLKIISRGSCHPSKVRDQVAVIKKRVGDVTRGVAVGIYAAEVETFIKQHKLDEKSTDALRTCSSQVQRHVLDKGPCLDAKNPSAVILVRVREAQRGGQMSYLDGRGKRGDQSIPGMAYQGGIRREYNQAANPPPVDYGAGVKRPAVDMIRPSDLESEAGVPVATWLNLGPSSFFAQAGFPAEGCGFSYNKKMGIFFNADSILAEILNNIESPTSLQIEHDEQWKKFPGIGDMYKAETQEENCFAVATSQEFMKWAVGFHAAKVGRELSAKLALAVAIVSGDPMEARISKLFPDFAILLDEVAIGKEIVKCNFKQPRVDLGPPPTPGSGAGTGKPSKFDQMPHMMAAPAIPASSGDPMAYAAAKAEATTFGLIGSPTPGMALAAQATVPGAMIPFPGAPRTSPDVQSIRLSDPETSSLCQRGYLPEAPAITYEKSLNGDFFSQAADILCSLTASVISVEIRHDDDWSKFPEIANSLKSSGLAEESYALALCPDLTKWGIGLAGSWKNRESAARLALCLAIALETPHLQKTMTDYPCFKQMCVNIGLVPAQ